MARKLHFIVAAVGTAGDTLPLIGLARHLVTRGHDVDLLAFDAFALPAQQAGLNFHRVGEVGLYEVLARDATVWYWHTGFRSLWKYLNAAMPDCVAHVVRLRRSGTVLVASSGAVGLRLAHEKHGLPLATVHMSPFYFFSTHANVLGGLGAWPALAPQWARKLVMSLIDRFFIDGACRDDVNQMRKSMGLAPMRAIFTKWIHSPQRVICAVPTWFAPHQPDWPAHAVSVSYPTNDLKSEATEGSQWVPEPKLETFLAGASRPVLFSAGTGAGAALTFFARAVEVARLTGWRVVLVTRWPEQLPESLPENVCHIEHAPFDQLLPRVAAIVHNGGIGTIALAMRAGIPQVIVPFAYDQFYNGSRLAALGGGAVIRRQRKPCELVVAIAAVMESSAIRASCIENQLRMQHSSHGIVEMSKYVEALAELT